MPHQGWRTRSALPFTYGWRENNWIHAFPKCVSAMWNAISFIQDLNLCRRVHFLRRWPLHHGHLLRPFLFLPFSPVTDCIFYRRIRHPAPKQGWTSYHTKLNLKVMHHFWIPGEFRVSIDCHHFQVHPDQERKLLLGSHLIDLFKNICIWIRLGDSLFYDNNRYAKRASTILSQSEMQNGLGRKMNLARWFHFL